MIQKYKRKFFISFCVFFIFLIVGFVAWCIKTKNPGMSLLHNSEINLGDSDTDIIKKDNLVLYDGFIPTHQQYKKDGKPKVLIHGIDFDVFYSLFPKHGLNILSYSRKFDERIFKKMKMHLLFKYGFPYFNEANDETYEIKWNVGDKHSRYIVVLIADEEYLLLSMETRNMVK